jgi:hypothetical protein
LLIRAPTRLGPLALMSTVDVSNMLAALETFFEGLNLVSV